MTKFDIRLEYKNKTGQYPLKGVEGSLFGELEVYKQGFDEDLSNIPDILDYLNYLEIELSEIRTLFNISTKTLENCKKFR